MKELVKWIEYKGEKILFNNFSGLNEEEYMKALDLCEKEILHCNESLLLTLTDASNTFATEKTKNRAKELEENTKHIKRLSAAIGITGIKKAIAKAIKKNIYFAHDIEEAKEWLINNKKKNLDP